MLNNLIKKCKYCKAPIPMFKIDTRGRTVKASDYCDNNSYCRNAYLYTVKHPHYFKRYYQDHKEKYKNGKNSTRLRQDNGIN